MRIYFALIGMALGLLISRQAAAENLTVKINWEYQSLPTVMKIFELKAGEHPALWSMQTVKDAASLPIGKEIANGNLHVEKGTPRRFVLVYANDGDQPIYFFATPHHAEPAEFSLGFKFKCLCIDHAYAVPPHETWYRVVELRTSTDMAGDKIEITHTLVGIDENRMKKFSLKLPSLD